MRVFCHIAVQGILIILLLGVTILPVYAAHPTAEPRHVLLLNSYHQNMTWVRNITQAVEDELTGNGSDLVLHVENMDSKRFHSSEYLQSLLQTYRSKYRSTHFELILSSDNNAFDFLRLHGDTLFPGVPVVFCGVNYLQDEDLEEHANFTGIEEVFDAAATLELALQNHPGSGKVFIVNDYLKTGRAWEKTIRRQLAPYASRLQLEYAENLSLDELGHKLSGLEAGTIVLFGVYFSDRDGRYVTYERIGEVLAENSSVPVYCLLEFNVGKGVVGGNVISGYSQGQAMARMGTQILQGASPGSIPILRKGVNRNIFNYPQLKRFSIAEAGLPAERIIINRPFSFYRQYQTIIWITAGFIGFLLFTIVTLVFNIRLRRQTEKQLKRAQSYIRNIFNSMPSVLIGVDPQGLVTQWNREAEKQSGTAAKKAIGLPLEKVFPQLEAQLEKVSSALKSRQPQTQSKVTFNDTEKTRVSDVTVYPLTSNGSQGAVIRIDDITERVQLEEMIIQSDKMLSVGNLAAGMAHEINNPLAGILQSAQLMQMRLDPANPQNRVAAEASGVNLETLAVYLQQRGLTKMLETIMDSGRRAADIVANMLNFSRKSESNNAPHSLAKILDKTLGLVSSDYNLQSLYDFKNIGIIKEYAPDMPDVSCEETKIQQVFLNLFKNGAQAMFENRDSSSRPCFILRLTADGSFAQVEIEDNGPGMNAEVCKRSFEPFFTTKEVGAGTGLGLSVSYFIITEQHQGTMSVESLPGQGARFTIRLPLATGSGPAGCA